MVYEDEDAELIFEQVGLVIGKNFVITIQELPGRDVFDPVRQRLREGGGNARFMASDYLGYALIDAVVDHFFPIVESLGESIEDMQESLLELPTREKLEGVHEFIKHMCQCG